MNRENQLSNKVLRALHDDSEIRTALRQLFAAGAPYEEAEFVLLRSELLPLCFEITRLYDIPCTFDPGVPLHYSKAARTVACWLRWIADDGNGQHLIRMMYDGIPAPQEFRHEGERGGRLQMAAMLRRAGIGSGRDHMAASVDAYIRSLETGAADNPRTLHQAIANREWLRAMLAITPVANADAFYSMHAVAAGAHALVRTLCRDAYPGEELALSRLGELMTQRMQQPDSAVRGSDAAAEILELIRGSFFPMVLQSPGSDAIPTTSPLPGHLHVSTIESGELSEREKIILVGMNEELAQGTASQDLLKRCGDRIVAVPENKWALGPLSLSEWWLCRCHDRDRASVRTALESFYPLHGDGARADATQSAEIVDGLELKSPPPWRYASASPSPEQLLRCEKDAAVLPELWQFMNILRVLADPENPFPVVEFLLGPFCGADLSSLLAYQQAGGQFAFNTRAIPGTDERISRGLQFLKDTVRLVRSNPPGTVITSIVERLALHAVIATTPAGTEGVAALDNILALIRFWSAGGSSLPEIAQLLDASPLLTEPLSWHSQFSSGDFHANICSELSTPRKPDAPSAPPLAEAAGEAAARIRSMYERAARPIGA